MNHVPRRTVLRRGPVAAALLATVVGLTACADTGSSDSADASGEKTDGSIIVITPNPVGGNNFLELAVDGAKKVAKDENLDLRVFESTDPTSIQQNVEAAVREKPDIVVGLSFSLQDAFATVPVDNPDQQFLLVDACPEPQPDNVTCAAFKEHEATYLAGVEAGLLSQTKKIGVVAAVRRWRQPLR
jgi:basic membrane protein A